MRGNPCFCWLRIALVTFNWKRLRCGCPWVNMMGQVTEFTPNYTLPWVNMMGLVEHRRSIFQGRLSSSCRHHMRSGFVPPSGVVPNRWWYLAGLCHFSVVYFGWLLTLRKHIRPMKKNRIHVAFVKQPESNLRGLLPNNTCCFNWYIDLWYSCTSIFTKQSGSKWPWCHPHFWVLIFHLFGHVQYPIPWASTTIKIIVFPQFRWLKPLGNQWWLYENTHCFIGGCNPRVFVFWYLLLTTCQLQSHQTANQTALRWQTFY